MLHLKNDTYNSKSFPKELFNDFISNFSNYLSHSKLIFNIEKGFLIFKYYKIIHMVGCI
jgi:hypothetical protein